MQKSVLMLLALVVFTAVVLFTLVSMLMCTHAQEPARVVTLGPWVVVVTTADGRVL